MLENEERKDQECTVLGNDAVEKTVDEVNKQIQTVTLVANETMDDEHTDNEVVKQVYHEALELFNNFINYVKTTSKEMQESEQFKATCDFVVDKSKFIADETTKKFNEIKEDQKLKDDMSSFKKSCVDTYDSVLSKFKEDEDLMKTYNSVKEETVKITKQGINLMKDGFDEFTSNPKVSEAIEKGKDVTLDVAEKAVDSLKNLLRPSKDDKQD